MRRRLFLLACSAMLLGAAPPPAGITVFAAASLTDALGALGRAYTQATGVPVRFSFASSSQVARQINGGARADLFVSADSAWMDEVQRAGRVQPGTRATLLRGRLVLVAARGTATRLAIRPGFPLAQALGARGRLAVGDPAFVPAGRYAQAALTRLGVWPSVAGRLARAENVRVALAYVARGEAPLGIVYGSDAKVERGVRVVGVFPAASHPPIVYPAALVKGAAPQAAGFLRFLQGAHAQAAFARFGFLPAR
ncbi:molybdate ABC transporter substrate-binding protein [Sphingomonas aracearum]|uniref:Molybdate ABC transporter substrate-binding protein n=1 Tax=Sphingomonas aracearum TaxID=2283317 RepID=A0A369VXU0_9SPHN|nr:molybdate ABC transporter substrate-binding protein [Sphingomonas aracearum]RDE07204.1 molybdate ABC transporter substrate-binding protein [Sphingomonas aracearum]